MVTRNACFKADIKSTDIALIKKCRLPANSGTTLQRFNYQNWSMHKEQIKDNTAHIHIFLEIALLLKIEKFAVWERFQVRYVKFCFKLVSSLSTYKLWLICSCYPVAILICLLSIWRRRQTLFAGGSETKVDLDTGTEFGLLQKILLCTYFETLEWVSLLGKFALSKKR